jgi:hypothetical protein
MAGYFGDFAALEINTAGESESAAYERLLCTTAIRINQSRDKMRVDCQGSGNKQYAVGKPDFQFSAEGMYDPANTALFTALDSNEAVNLRITPYDDSGHIEYTGDFVLEQFEIEARQDQIITVTLSGGASEDIVQSFIP